MLRPTQHQRWCDFRSLGPGLDTLLVGGGRATWELPKNEDFLTWLEETGTKVRRLAAIGSGAFFLAEAGLLQGKRATTHWRWADRLKTSYPSILVDPTPVLYVMAEFTHRPVSLCPWI